MIVSMHRAPIAPLTRRPTQKQTDPAKAARIRNNQRRSRARHREFVEDLKARVREYERRGVQATLEMRQAARAVALENARLRSLLALRGVSEEEIEAYLASFHHHHHHDNNNDNNNAQPSGDPTFPRQAGRPMSHAASPAPALDMLAVLADASAQQTGYGQSAQYLPAAMRTGGVEARGRVPEACTPSSSSSSGSSGKSTENAKRNPSAPGEKTASSHLEMSCTAAAEIMASISYRDRSEELAREALGCSGPGECFVKNTKLFELLESSEAV